MTTTTARLNRGFTFTVTGHGLSSRVSVCTTERDWRDATGLLLDYFGWVSAALGLASVESVQPIASLERRDLAAVYAEPGHAMLLARLGVQPAGITGLRATTDPDTVELVRVFVHPIARGTGLGRLLLRRAIMEAAQLGYRRMVLDTMPEQMPAAVRLYEQAGFRIAWREDGMPVSDSIRLERELGSARVAAVAR